MFFKLLVKWPYSAFNLVTPAVTTETETPFERPFCQHLAQMRWTTVPIEMFYIELLSTFLYTCDKRICMSISSDMHLFILFFQPCALCRCAAIVLKFTCAFYIGVIFYMHKYVLLYNAEKANLMHGYTVYIGRLHNLHLHNVCRFILFWIIAYRCEDIS